MEFIREPNIEKLCISMGTDPEVFAFNENKLLPAFSYLPAKMDSEFENIDSRYHQEKSIRSFWDGFQAEFEIYRGVTCIMQLQSCIRGGLQQVLNKARKKYPGAKLSIKNTVDVEQSLLEQLPEAFVSFGCMPSYNIYKTKPLEIPDPRLLLKRFAGGHMHFSYIMGYGDGYSMLKEGFVKPLKELDSSIGWLDQIAGIWSVGAAANIDDPYRRKFYGRAGEWRGSPEVQKVVYNEDTEDEYTEEFQHFEWRTPSNFWLSHPAVCGAMFDIARQALRYGYFIKKMDLPKWTSPGLLEVAEIINKCDVKAARQILSENKDTFDWLMSNAGKLYQDLSTAFPSARKAIFEMGMEGIEKFIVNPDDIERNWLLNKNYEQAGWKNARIQNGVYDMFFDGPRGDND